MARSLHILAVAALAGNACAAGVDFAADIRPIFNAHCTKCHGGVKEKSGLNLTYRDGTMREAKSGLHAIIPGKPEESELIARIVSKDEDERMPPEEPLKPEEIEKLRKWIAGGAEWPRHWSFEPRKPDPQPEVKNPEWVLNPIDRYILAKQESAGITPSPKADTYTLIRRVAIDLTGLTPDTKEADAFHRKPTDAAYEQMVDRYLASPHFGERWGRHWLDQARFADSDGYEKDSARPGAWRWRDWVIDAINDDMPFDQFTKLQMAGDLFPNASQEHRLATAFHLQTLFNREGGVDPEEDRTKRVIDRINTTGSVWLGLTLGCMQCHSHPYDPMKQREFYQFYAFFNNADEHTIEVARLAKPDPKIVPLQNQLARERVSARKAFDQWHLEAHTALRTSNANPERFYTVKSLSVKSEGGAKLENLDDGSVLVSGPTKGTDVYTLEFTPEQDQVTGFKLEVLTHDSLPRKGPGGPPNGNFVLSEFHVAAEAFPGRPPVGLALASATADFSQKEWEIAKAIDGSQKTGWAVSPQIGKNHSATFVLARALPTGKRLPITIKLHQNYGEGKGHLIGRFRLSTRTGGSTLGPLPQQIRTALRYHPKRATKEQREQLLYHFTEKVHGPTAELISEIARLRKGSVLSTQVLKERKQKRETFVFHRGDFLQPKKSEGAVTANVPATLVPLAASSKSASRLDLAKWLVDPKNPLTTRVVANQIWSRLFGEGLVATVDDFGARGAPPSHPKLLDWLAEEFIRNGWSRKKLIKTILLSNTYQQASIHRPDLEELDPDNRLLHRQNRMRVEAEIIRDLHLQAGGLLTTKIGGPSVYPPIPPDVAEQSYANNFKWTPSKGEDRYRRGMYTFFKRTAPDPNLISFDCPDSNISVSKRNSSNTPIMALATLQNEVFHEAAANLARATLEEKALGTDSARLRFAFRRCLVRTPTPAESRLLQSLLGENRKYYEENPNAAKEAVAAFNTENPLPTGDFAAWLATVRIITNLDEFITRE